MEKDKPRKNCIICEKIIHRGSNSGIHLRRSRRAVTCSKPCARIYLRIHSYFWATYQHEIRRLKRRIKKLEKSK